MEVIRLVQVNFDILENQSSNAISEKELGMFVGSVKLSAHGNCNEFIKKMKPIGHFLGWNGRIYPQFKIYTSQTVA